EVSGVDLCRLFEKHAGGFVRLEQRLGFAQNREVVRALRAQPVASGRSGLIEGGLEHVLEPLPLRLVHRAVSSIVGAAAPSSARFNQARASAHCRLTVAGERPTTSAVSSTVSPPKYRSSTILARSASIAVSRVSASSSARTSISSGRRNAA